MSITCKYPFSKINRRVLNVSVFRSESSHLHPGNLYDMPYKGLECQIPTSNWKLIEAWKTILQALSHPLWFPLLCLAITPVIAFILITWEMTGFNTSSKTRSTLKSKKMIGSLLCIYFILFFFDLIQFATQPNAGTELEFTHAQRIQSGINQRNDLILVYVFHHWTRPMASCIRNLLCMIFIIKDRDSYVTLLKK